MSMDSQEDAIACYELQMPEICGTQPLAACFLLGFHSKNRASPAKNSSATATTGAHKDKERVT